MYKFIVSYQGGSKIVYGATQMAVFNYINAFYPNLVLISIRKPRFCKMVKIP